MSKHHKHSESPPGSGSRASGGVFSRRVLLQLLAIVGLSCALGFTFNAASPVGVRFGEPTAAPIAPKATTEATPIPATSVRTNLIAAPPLPPVPVKVVATTPQPPPSAPKPVVTPLVVPVSPPQTITNPVVAATPPPAQPNPAPIHWPEAKVMVAEGRAVLVDVRHKAMFDAGHIPGATSLPESSPPQEFAAFLNQQPTNLTVIVYCSSTSCSQSARVSARLVNEFHWPSVRYMTGGYLEYQQAELARPAPAPTP